ncbi:BgTH12-02377 [Blumeria graminis f. sp. triticale]|uniref:BgTH12-02377 n=1 Tax=Blumeria graminis f. sp. triticale TaxID=1689686 RepID=A0A9W4DLJ8_BLUGR|nr:BgTH12-02377 [Blumeria graminis f. sp. triticale]
MNRPVRSRLTSDKQSKNFERNMTGQTDIGKLIKSLSNITSSDIYASNLSRLSKQINF